MTKWFTSHALDAGLLCIAASGHAHPASLCNVLTTSSRGNDAPSRFSQRIFEMVLFSSIINFLNQEREYRATTSLLHAMDDHRLADIGIRRDQIDSLVAEQRELKRQKAASEAENRPTQRPAVGGHGLAAQH
jgi:uncharacterized protein YjiS (DUF1127 family)